MNHRGSLTIGFLIGVFLLVAVEPFGVQSAEMRAFTQDISRSFTDKPYTQSAWVFLVFFIFLAILAVSLIYVDVQIRRRNKAGIDNPRYLFIELVRVHDLTRIEKQFLIDFTEESDLEDPLPLFIEPQYFLLALNDDRFQESHRMIVYLLRKLFDIDYKDFRSSTKRQEQSYLGETTITRPFR